MRLLCCGALMCQRGAERESESMRTLILSSGWSSGCFFIGSQFSHKSKSLQAG